jgi:hypothetical protein
MNFLLPQIQIRTAKIQPVLAGAVEHTLSDYTAVVRLLVCAVR